MRRASIDCFSFVLVFTERQYVNLNFPSIRLYIRTTSRSFNRRRLLAHQCIGKA